MPDSITNNRSIQPRDGLATASGGAITSAIPTVKPPSSSKTGSTSLNIRNVELTANPLFSGQKGVRSMNQNPLLHSSNPTRNLMFTKTTAKTLLAGKDSQEICNNAKKMIAGAIKNPGAQTNLSRLLSSDKIEPKPDESPCDCLIRVSGEAVSAAKKDKSPCSGHFEVAAILLSETISKKL